MPGVSDDWKVIIGVSAISLRRYMSSPAGLIDIEAKSAPSEVKAPPSAIERAVPNACGCDICAISPANTPSWFSTAPPKASVPRCCACNDPVATSAAAHIAICNFLIIRCCLTRLNI